MLLNDEPLLPIRIAVIMTVQLILHYMMDAGRTRSGASLVEMMTA